MEHHDNEQRLRILQERLGQIKNKQEAKHDEQPKVDNTPPYPTYNPKATQSSNENIAHEETEKEKVLIKDIDLLHFWSFHERVIFSTR